MKHTTLYMLIALATAASAIASVSPKEANSIEPVSMNETVIEKNQASGGRDTDLNLDATTGDNWINIYSRDTTVVASSTSTCANAASRPHGQAATMTAK